jgi:predicted DCC family thiol-disulfide oxidoreductase YuxK
LVTISIPMDQNNFSHLVFYDGECGFCDCSVQLLLKVDKHGLFAFAPLQGKTAATMLKDLPAEMKNVDSLILIENYKTKPVTYNQSKAVFRIFWLLGGLWKVIGVLSFLPSILFDWGYRLVARNRKFFGIQTDHCTLPMPDQQGRFLP